MNHHASALVLGEKGLLIEGPSGSGKSSLASAIIDLASCHGRHGAWISDDQVLLTKSAGRLVAAAPTGLQGLMEWSGHGILAVPFLPAGVIDHVVQLVESDKLQRMPEASTVARCGVELPEIRLPRRQSDRNARLLLQLLLHKTEKLG